MKNKVKKQRIFLKNSNNNNNNNNNIDKKWSGEHQKEWKAPIKHIHTQTKIRKCKQNLKCKVQIENIEKTWTTLQNVAKWELGCFIFVKCLSIKDHLWITTALNLKP